MGLSAVTPKLTGRKIIHVDMDCFYAAVELLDRPEYEGRPLAVGGSPGGRGVLCTSNYEARKFGVRSAMSSSLAVKLCPDLVIVPPAFSKYKKASDKIQNIFSQYTSVIEPLSLDEAYLDVTDCEHFEGNAEYIAREIKEKIYEETGLTCSAGVAPNKFLAKIASDWQKPNGITVIPPHDVLSFVKDLPIGKINGVGKVTESKLKSLGFHTCADIRNHDPKELELKLGSYGRWLYRLSWGEDDRKVGSRGLRKSLSMEHTFREDLPNIQECQRVASGLVLELRQRLLNYENRLAEKNSNLPPIKNLVLKMKFKDFTRVTRECVLGPQYWPQLKEKAEQAEQFYKLVDELTKIAFESKSLPVRLLGLGVRFDVKDQKENKDNKQLRLL